MGKRKREGLWDYGNGVGRECVYVCVFFRKRLREVLRERERVFKCVCMCVFERERESLCMCLSERGIMCVCQREIEKGMACERVGECVCERVR